MFVALFLLNLALSATYTPVLGVPDECIREINKVYLSTSEEEKLSVAESIANKYIKDNVLQNIFPDKKYEDKLNRVKNYNTTIRNIKSEAEQRSKPSVFSKENSFIQLSFKDIFTAYNNVIENKPSFYPDYGTERYINSADTDLMMLVFVLMLTVIVCCRDKMTGMAAVIRQNSQRAYSQCRSKADSLLFAYRCFGCVVIRYEYCLQVLFASGLAIYQDVFSQSRSLCYAI
ncbi:MAG: hypothetical protein ACLTZI_05025 [[Eubacterium] siraeum]